LGSRRATGALVGARDRRLEEPGEQQDDDDERDQTATDVHSGLLCSVVAGTTAHAVGGLRGPRYDEPARRRGRVVRQRPAKPRTAVRIRSSPSIVLERLIR